MTIINDIIHQSIENRLYQVHTCLPGRIETYDPQKKKATVQPLIKKQIVDIGSQSLPLITNVPVLTSFFSGKGISIPINAGDYCLILFSERSLDRWLTFGGEVENPDPRIFDLSDAIAIPGLMPFSDDSQIVSPNDITIKLNGASITLQQDGVILIDNGLGQIKIDALGKFRVQNGFGELFTVLIDSFTAINSFVSGALTPYITLLTSMRTP